MTSRAVDACPFCEFGRAQEPVARRGTFFAKYDKYPVSSGHMLLIPYRHVETIFELDEYEWADLFSLLLEVRDILQDRFKPDGLNIGVNVGVAAGQTISHLHVHIIPRYHGDIENPTGGVRGVIPNKADYGQE